MKKTNPKKKSTSDLILEVNGETHNLGKYVLIISGYCVAQKKQTKPTFKCLKTGKVFTDVSKLSKHLAQILVTTKKIILQ